MTSGDTVCWWNFGVKSSRQLKEGHVISVFQKQVFRSLFGVVCGCRCHKMSICGCGCGAVTPEAIKFVAVIYKLSLTVALKDGGGECQGCDPRSYQICGCHLQAVPYRGSQRWERWLLRLWPQRLSNLWLSFTSCPLPWPSFTSRPLPAVIYLRIIPAPTPFCYPDWGLLAFEWLLTLSFFSKVNRVS